MGDGSLVVTPVNINPGFANASSVFFGQQAQINNKNQVVAEDRISTTTPATTSIRIWDALLTDQNTFVGRGGPGRAYDAGSDAI